ncbi:uncharacterized protein LOC144129558 [Amblyomma americanum]
MLPREPGPLRGGEEVQPGEDSAACAAWRDRGDQPCSCCCCSGAWLWRQQQNPQTSGGPPVVHDNMVGPFERGTGVPDDLHGLNFKPASYGSVPTQDPKAPRGGDGPTCDAVTVVEHCPCGDHRGVDDMHKHSDDATGTAAAGDLTLRVGFRDVLVDCPLMVFDCEGPSLCGRDLLTLQDNAGAPVLHLTPACGATETSETDTCKIKSIFSDYQDVFTTELGLMKGPPASLRLKDEAIPKFCREFTLVTDDQPLVSPLRPDRQTPTMTAARIQRWALYLGGYNYKLQYVPGKQLLNSDALSRLTQQTTRDRGEGPTEGSHDWTRPPDSSLYVRNYGQGEKWIPGHVKSATGARMVTVEPPTAIIKRQVDQVRHRSDSSPRFPVTDTTARGPGPSQTKGPCTAANVTTPLEAAAPDYSPDRAQIAGNNIQPRTSLLPPTLSPAEASQ